MYESADYNAALRFAELLLHKLTPNGENDENPSDLSIDPHEHKLALSKCYRWLGHIYLKLNHKSTSVSYFKKGKFHQHSMKETDVKRPGSLSQSSLGLPRTSSKPHWCISAIQALSIGYSSIDEFAQVTHRI